MDFSKLNEKKSYIIGKKLGFLFSYTVFFTITYFVLSGFKIINFPYIYFIGGALLLHLIYTLVKPLIFKKIKME